MPSRLLAGLPERGLQAAIGPGDLFSDDSNLDVTSWGVVFTSCGLFVFSAVSLIAGKRVSGRKVFLASDMPMVPHHHAERTHLRLF